MGNGANAAVFHPADETKSGSLMDFSELTQTCEGKLSEQRLYKSSQSVGIFLQL